MFSLYKNSVFLVCTGLHDQSESRGASISIKKSNSVPNINPNANVHVILTNVSTLAACTDSSYRASLLAGREPSCRAPILGQFLHGVISL